MEEQIEVYQSSKPLKPPGKRLLAREYRDALVLIQLETQYRTAGDEVSGLLNLPRTQGDDFESFGIL